MNLTPIPLELHRSQVLADGTLVGRDIDILRFRFNHQGFRFKGRINTLNTTRVLELAGATGMLPFSAQDICKRSEIAEIIKQSRQLKNVKFVFRFDNRIFTKGVLPVRDPITATHMMSATVETILIMEPYLKLLSGYLIQDAATPVH